MKLACRSIESRRWLPAFLLLLVLLRIPMWLDTRPPDGMLFASVGQLIAEGGRPYVDAVDNKPPGVYLLNSLPLRIAPYRLEGIYGIEAAWLLLAAGVGYRVARKILGAAGGRWALFLLLFSIGMQALCEGANMTETYALLPVGLGYLAFF